MTAAPCGALRRRKVLNNPILGLPTERRDLSAGRGRDTFRLCRRARLAAGGQPGATTPATLTCSAAASRWYEAQNQTICLQHPGRQE
jgi:hypothetical protein